MPIWELSPSASYRRLLLEPRPDYLISPPQYTPTDAQASITPDIVLARTIEILQDV